MKRPRRIRVEDFKVIIEPVQAPEEEYEKAWNGALQVLYRLSRRLEARQRAQKD